MAEDHAPYHTLEDDPDLVRPFDPPHAKESGKGGTRHGFVAKNEIEDMTIFDAEPDKAPSGDGIHNPKSIDEKGDRERK